MTCAAATICCCLCYCFAGRSALRCISSSRLIVLKQDDDEDYAGFTFVLDAQRRSTVSSVPDKTRFLLVRQIKQCRHCMRNWIKFLTRVVVAHSCPACALNTLPIHPLNTLYSSAILTLWLAGLRAKTAANISRFSVTSFGGVKLPKPSPLFQAKHVQKPNRQPRPVSGLCI